MFRHQKNSRNGSRKGRIQRQFRLTSHHDGRSRSIRNLFTVNRLKQADFNASEESAQTIFFSFPLFSAVDPCNFIPSGMLVKPLKVIKQRCLRWWRFLPLWNDLKCGNEACLIPTFIPTFWHNMHKSIPTFVPTFVSRFLSHVPVMMLGVAFFITTLSAVPENSLPPTCE